MMVRPRLVPTWMISKCLEDTDLLVNSIQASGARECLKPKTDQILRPERDIWVDGWPYHQHACL